MEEQRARQEDESRKAKTASASEQGADKGADESVDEQMLKEAMEMSMQTGDTEVTHTPRDLSNLSEEEQIAYALQMSLHPGTSGTAMDVGESDVKAESKMEENEDDYSDVMNDPAFLQSVLEDLPGVNPQDEAVKEAVKQLTKTSGAAAEGKEDKKKDGKGKKDDKK
jgi:26S proteasome regulatory subunit N10